MKSIFYIICLFFIYGCVSQNTNVYEGYKVSGNLTNDQKNFVRKRHLDIVNALRVEKKLNKLKMSPRLNASADTHARDLFFQKRAWNFGSDLSSPYDRGKVVNFFGDVIGENVSETFEGEFEVLQVWLNNKISSNNIFNPYLTHIGLGIYQEKNGKVWWVQDFGIFNDKKD